jgi:hypothetical protein
MTRYKYQDFDLLVVPGDKGGYWAQVSRSPVGESSRGVLFRAPFTRDEVVGLARQVRGLRDLGQVSDESATPAAIVAEFGQRLFEAVFAGDVGRCFGGSLPVPKRTIPGVRRGLRIRLRLGACPELADLPWEILYDPARGRFLCLSNETPLVRYPAQPAAEPPLTVFGSLRMLVVIASPATGPWQLDTEAERARLSEALAKPVRRRDIVVDWIARPTLDELERPLGRSAPRYQQQLALLRRSIKKRH